MFTVHQAKTQLCKLNAESLAGEEVIVARGSTPVTRLTPIATPKRVYGAYAGQFELTDTFFEPLPQDEVALWHGERG